MNQEQHYLDLLQKILDKGLKNVDRGTGAVSYSLFGEQIRFNLSQGFPLLTTKKVFWKGILHELFWFLKGDSRVDTLTKAGVHIWDDYPYKIYKEKELKAGNSILEKDEFVQKLVSDTQFAEKWGNLKNIYGESWRRWPTKDKSRTVDQLQWVIDELKEDPDARNLIVNSWNPEFLYGMAKPELACRFPICHNMFQVSQKDGKISLQLYQRSADMFLGVPFNIASYALLTIIIAKITGYQPGEFIHTFGDLHIYENHLEQVKEQLTRQPTALPTVKISRENCDLENIQIEDVVLENYTPHPPLKAELTVAGGYFDKKANTQA